MYRFKSPALLSKIYYSAWWRLHSKEQAAFLTFDDGPHPEVTPWVLEVLDRFDAKATFFCVGENVERYPEVYQEILKRGHAVGNHTYNHLKGWQTETQTYLDNISKCATVVDSKLFRPPYGKMTPQQVRAIRNQYQIVMWSILSRDFDPKLNTHDSLRVMVRNTLPGSILVFHDSLKAQKNLSYLLPKTLEALQKKGFSFKALG